MEAIGKEQSIEWDRVPFREESPVFMDLLGVHLGVAAITDLGNSQFLLIRQFLFGVDLYFRG